MKSLRIVFFIDFLWLTESINFMSNGMKIDEGILNKSFRVITYSCS